MSRTVTLRLPDETYERFRTLAEQENRPLSNFVETAVLRYVAIEQFADEILKRLKKLPPRESDFLQTQTPQAGQTHLNYP